MKRNSAHIFGVLASALALAGIGWSFQEQKTVSERSIEFNERIGISIPKGSSNVRVWIPIPVNDAFQLAELLSVESPYRYRITQEKDFGNRLIYLEPKSTAPSSRPQLSGGLFAELTLYSLAW